MSRVTPEGIQPGLPFGRPAPSRSDVVSVNGHPVPLVFVRTKRARHYILRIVADGSLRVTVPWHGSKAQARVFVDERHDWIARERHARTIRAAKEQAWGEGTPVLFGGQEHPLRLEPGANGRLRVSFADQSFMLAAAHAGSLRAAVEVRLRRLAAVDLPERLAALALTHGFDVKAVSIRNQRSRWGSCSATGRISLNWRLVQFPPDVTTYVLLHELVHLRHLNHSRRFWTELARLCPTYQASRAWLRRHAKGSEA